jgi:hypothetical protein
MAWLITKSSSGLGIEGIAGPASATDAAIAKLAKGGGFVFRLRDDDGGVLCEGRSSREYSFAPLDDYGMPSLGATEIQYRVGKNSWETL